MGKTFKEKAAMTLRLDPIEGKRVPKGHQQRRASGPMQDRRKDTNRSWREDWR